jgi:hypothetical protein
MLLFTDRGSVYDVLLFGDHPRTVVEVVYVALYQALGHVSGLLFVVGTMLPLAGLIHGADVIGVVVASFHHPVSVGAPAHLMP